MKKFVLKLCTFIFNSTLWNKFLFCFFSTSLKQQLFRNFHLHTLKTAENSYFTKNWIEFQLVAIVETKQLWKTAHMLHTISNTQFQFFITTSFLFLKRMLIYKLQSYWNFRRRHTKVPSRKISHFTLSFVPHTNVFISSSKNFFFSVSFCQKAIKTWKRKWNEMEMFFGITRGGE